MTTTLARLTAGTSVIELRHATPDDLPAIVSLLAADQLGHSKESGDRADLEPYRTAFRAIDADPAQLLVSATAGEQVGTFRLTFIPASPDAGRCARRSRRFG